MKKFTQNDEIYIKQNITVMNEKYSTFLQLHSLDLKYMVPWSQYENNALSETEPKKKPTNLINEEKKLE